ncbi:MAG: hypothetical protein QM758_07060 [Armatimonas sp.]
MKLPKALRVVLAMIVVEGSIGLMNYSHEAQFRGAMVTNLLFSPDSRIVYGSGINFTSPKQIQGGLWAWDTETGRLLWKTELPELDSAVLSPNGAMLLTVSPEGNPLLWNAATGKVCGELKRNPDRKGIGSAYFTPDSRRVLGCFQDGIQVWDAQTGERKAFWKTTVSWPENLQFSTDGKKVLARPNDESILWDSQSGRVLRRYKNAPLCTLAPSGKTVAQAQFVTPTDIYGERICRVVLRDIATDTVQVQSSKFPPGFSLNSLEFLPDGNLLCTGTYRLSGHEVEPQAFLWDTRENWLTEHPVADTGDRVLSPNKHLKVIANWGGYRIRPPLGTLYNATSNTKICDLEGLAGR